MRIDGSVPRIESPSREEFTEKFLIPQNPVVISGATRDWKAYTAWTLDHLKEVIGQRKVRVKESTTNVHPDLFSTSRGRLSEWEFGDYVDLISSDRLDRNKYYLSGDEIKFVSDYVKLDQSLAPLISDFVIPDYCDRDLVKTIGFWLSAQGVIASLHYDSDGSHNLNVQVKGKKRVLLFSPNQLLHPFGGIHMSQEAHNFSRINIRNPDESRFPSFRNAKCIEAVIEEGDMLFIPSYWHHAVFHLGRVNINVNFWWQPTQIILSKTSFRATFLSLLYSALAEGIPIPDLLQAKSAWESLPPETREFIQKMECLIPQQYRI